MERRAEPDDERPAEDTANGSLREESARSIEAAHARSGFDFERAWRVAAYALLACAGLLILLRRPEAAFFAAALGVSAWFLNVRTGLKRKHDLVRDGARNWRPRRDVKEELTEEEE